MKAWHYFFVILTVLTRESFAQAPISSNLPPLSTRIKAYIEQPRFARAQWGIKVVSQTSGQVVFEHSSQKLMIPASNTKLFTAALALDRLGPEFRIKTSLRSAARPDTNGILNGDLIIYGRGDPTISARFNNGDHENLLKPFVGAIRAAGIKQIEGDLVGNESYFRCTPHGNGWSWDDFQWAYGAPVSALSYDDNAFSVTVKPGKNVGEPCIILAKNPLVTFQNLTKTTSKISDLQLYRPNGSSTVFVTGGLPVGGSPYADFLAMPNPALWFIFQLKQALEASGIKISGQVRTEDWLTRPADNSADLAIIESRPLKEIVKETMKSSQNQYAQLLLLQVGAQKSKPKSQVATDQLGLSELQKFIAEVKIQPGSVFLKDGAGMSDGTYISPDAIVMLLNHMARHRNASAYAESLPIAGVDGSLQNRFKNTAAQGRVWAKTGTKEFTSALSGYAVTRNGEHLTFSVILNNYKDASGNASPRSETDAVVQMLAE